MRHDRMKRLASDRRTKPFLSSCQILELPDCFAGELRCHKPQVGSIGADQGVIAKKIELTRNPLAVVDQHFERSFAEDFLRAATALPQLVVDVFEGLLSLQWVQYRPRADALMKLTQRRFHQSRNSSGWPISKISRCPLPYSP